MLIYELAFDILFREWTNVAQSLTLQIVTLLHAYTLTSTTWFKAR